MTDEQPCNIQVAIEAGKQIADAESRICQPGGIPVSVVPDGMKVAILNELLRLQDEREPAPRRLRGTATHQELESFCSHVNRFKDAASTIWADTLKLQLTAIFNYHQGTSTSGEDPEIAPASARWADHRSVYACPLSEEWELWMGHNEKWLGQEEFGRFIEDNFDNLANPTPNDEFPPPARVLEVARSLQINAKRQFERTINPTSGEGVFTWKEEHEKTGSTKVPKSFLVGIPVFEAGEAYRIQARLRYRISDGRAQFQYGLYQAQVVLRDAFEKVRSLAQLKTGLPVFAGNPEQ